MTNKTYQERLCRMFGFSPDLHPEFDRRQPVLLLYTPHADDSTTYILKSWGSRKDYTVIKARTLSQMTFA